MIPVVLAVVAAVLPSMINPFIFTSSTSALESYWPIEINSWLPVSPVGNVMMASGRTLVALMGLIS